MGFGVVDLEAVEDEDVFGPEVANEAEFVVAAVPDFVAGDFADVPLAGLDGDEFAHAPVEALDLDGKCGAGEDGVGGHELAPFE